MSSETTIPTPPENNKTPHIDKEIDLFTKHIDSIGTVLLSLMLGVQQVAKKVEKSLDEFEAAHCEVKKEGTTKTVKVPSTHFRQWKRHIEQFEQLQLSRSLLPRSILVSLVSQYDAYLGRLLRVIFVSKPEILNGSERKLTFENLSEFSNIEAAREYILEKEVESILRSSHVDQFRWMERTFGVPLTKDLARWPTFIELTERRNLFVHTDGVVSSQYISVCTLHHCSLEADIKEGKKLEVEQEYFRAAHDCVYEIGIKLGHVLWRKLFPEEREQADTSLIKISYDLIDHRRYDLAIRLLDFVFEGIKKFSNEANQLALTVNRAQAYKWKGDEEKSKKIMRAVDWSAKGEQFRLANAVLLEDWDQAGKIMLRLGKEGPIDETEYRDWPLFRNFRKQEQFLAAYQDIFGEAFTQASKTTKTERPAPAEQEATEDVLATAESSKTQMDSLDSGAEAT